MVVEIQCGGADGDNDDAVVQQAASIAFNDMQREEAQYGKQPVHGEFTGEGPQRAIDCTFYGE